MKAKVENEEKWYEKIPHPVVILFGIILLVTILTYIIPAGSFQREVIDDKMRVIPGTYVLKDSKPVSILNMFKAIPLGFKTAAEIIFAVLAGGIMFGILEKTRMVENVIGTVIKRLGLKRRFLIVVIVTYIYGLLGVAVGYENNIAMVPIAAVLGLALGGDLILAAGMSVGAITVGFGLSPINPYTVGVGHQIAEMPMFSGAIMRSVLCFTGLSALAYFNVRYFKRILEDPKKSKGTGLDTEGLALSKNISQYSITPNNYLILGIFLIGLVFMLFGIFQYGWYINEISSIFLMIAVAAGICGGLGGKVISETAFKSISIAAPGAFMVGYATTIKVLLEMGEIADTICYKLAGLLTMIPSQLAAISMSAAQSCINLFIPSGSGQALATLPIMIPVGDLLGLTRQTTILAFQIGDGVTNLFNPTLGGLIAMLSLCRVPLDRWIRFIFPLAIALLLISWVVLTITVIIEWGPA